MRAACRANRLLAGEFTCTIGGQWVCRVVLAPRSRARAVKYVIGGEMDDRYIAQGRPLGDSAGSLRIDPKGHLGFVLGAVDRCEGGRADDQVRTDAIERCSELAGLREIE